MRLNNKCICYWPGIRRDTAELTTLFEVLIDSGYIINQIESVYDTGLPPDNVNSEIHKWVNCEELPCADWWIGLSLGAAVAHIVACTASAHRRPKRLTLINPFADRVDLSRIIGFQMNAQWSLKPVDFYSPGGIKLDLVLSRWDEHIPRVHSAALRNCYPVFDVTLIELEANHVVASPIQQQHLASVLLSI